LEGTRLTSPQELLKQNNPFQTVAVSSREIWNPSYPDVESIHKDAFNLITQVVQKKQAQSTMPLAVLVLGEAGTGKTHLLVRIAKYCSEENKGCSLVNIKPIYGISPMRWLMQGIFTDLFTELEKRPNDPLFQRLLSEVLSDFLLTHGGEKKVDAVLRDFFTYHEVERENVDDLSKQVIDWLTERDILLNRQFLQVLFQINNKFRRSAAIRWLIGRTLDASDAEMLGLSVDPETEETREIVETKEMGTHGLEIRASSVFPLARICNPCEQHAAYTENDPHFRPEQSEKKIKIGMIIMINLLEMKRRPLVGEVLETMMVIEEEFFSTTFVRSEVKIGDETIATCRMKLFLTDKTPDA